MRQLRTKERREGLVAVHPAALAARNTAQIPWHASC